MKKICHVTSAHPAEDGRIFRRACISTVRAGFDTYLVEQGESYDKEGVHIIGIGKPKRAGRVYRMTVFAEKAYHAAKKVNADLYQIHDPELLPYALKLKRAGKAVVFDSHEYYAEQFRNKHYLPHFLAVGLSKWYERYLRRVLNKIDGLTYPGNDKYPSVYDGLCKRVVTSDNLPWLFELYDKYDKAAIKEPNSVCYIGSLEEARGITQIVKASYDAGCKLYLGGVFYSDVYKQELMNLKEYTCVDYLGVLDRDQVVKLLQKVEVGLCCLLDIGQYYKMTNLPTKVYEYMSMGIPTVMNDSPYNARACQEMKIGLAVDPMNREELAKAIRKLLDAQDLREKYGANGRNLIKERYCWDKEQKKLLAMYQDILR